MGNAKASPLSGHGAIARARHCLDGLSVGDAFGETFFFDRRFEWRLETRTPPDAEGGWRWTDDTAMAVSLVRHLELFGKLEQGNLHDLADLWAHVYVNDPARGYGGHIQSLLERIHAGGNWETLAYEPFGGTGSMGNGSAMRVAPLGAYFADRVTDTNLLVEQARLSALPTHPHPEGIAGAIAVAIATAFAWNRSPDEYRKEIFPLVIDNLDAGPTRDGVELAAAIAPGANPLDAAQSLGNGSRVTCPDTVPLCLWISARCADSYEDALWTAAECEGDVDTTCAIIGGIVSGIDGSVIPQSWRQARWRVPLLDE